MLELGTVIGGKYCLEEQIAHGGMATVWRAVHMDLNRPVAVKFLTTDRSTGARDRERFLREARLAASVRHRFVVDTIDFGITDAGQAFIVMELLEGGSLFARLCEDQPLRAADLLGIIASTLKGLAAIHAQGIVHRDLKPENIVLVRDGDDSVVPKLVDFGISRAIVADDVRPLRLTRAGMIMGTPEYMSPEQARGLADVDLRADIYSMGVMVYESLTGVLPFEDENPGDLLVKIITGGPARPMSSVRSDLGEPLSRVVERAMAHDRNARHQTADELHVALEAAARETAESVLGWDSMRVGLLDPGEPRVATPGRHSTPTRRHAATSSPLPATSAVRLAEAPAPAQTLAAPKPARLFRGAAVIAMASAMVLALSAALVAGDPHAPGSGEATSSLERDKARDGTLPVPASTPVTSDAAEGAPDEAAAVERAGLATDARRGARPSSTTGPFRDPGF